jgi:hypothetical protein
MRAGSRHPRPGGGQLELCEVCGAATYNDELIELTVVGLQGVMACRRHAWMDTPGRNDLRGDLVADPEPSEREEPIGGPLTLWQIVEE